MSPLGNEGPKFRPGRSTLGGIGQTIAEAITGGHPASFSVELPSRSRLRADIYISERNEVIEVKAGGSRIREYQLAHYQKGRFSGGFSVMFVQDPFTGRIGPEIRDYMILRRMGVTYSQVWFTGVPYSQMWFGGLELSAPRRAKKSYRGARRTSKSPLLFSLGLGRKRGLRDVVVYLLSSTPMNGAQIMNEVESLTRGEWRPTAGSVYPLLRDMFEGGIISRTKRGDKYELSLDMKTELWGHLDASPQKIGTMSEMVNQMNSFVSYMEDAKSTKREDLKPHMGDLRGLAKRISDLASEEPNEEEKT